MASGFFDDVFEYEEYCDHSMQYKGVKNKIDLFGIPAGTDLGYMAFDEVTGDLDFYSEDGTQLLSLLVRPIFLTKVLNDDPDGNDPDGNGPAEEAPRLQTDSDG